MAGLLDMYVYCGNEQALDMAEKMAGWVDVYTDSLSYEHMQRVLGTEYGGMGEVLCESVRRHRKGGISRARAALRQEGSSSIRSPLTATNSRACTSTPTSRR